MKKSLHPNGSVVGKDDFNDFLQDHPGPQRIFPVIAVNLLK